MYIKWNGLIWINLAEDTDYWGALVTKVVEHSGSIKCVKFF